MAKDRTTTSTKKRPPVCGFTYRGKTCRKTGTHLCEPRAVKVKVFFAEVLVHTKGRYARKPFILARWQWLSIIKPLFGSVRWDLDLERYVRVYRIAWIEIARKNGKSELLAGIAMYLMMGDGEESAELYGAAKDTKQARKVWDVAERMVKLSPKLNRMLRKGTIKINVQEKRIIFEPRGSYYEVITADAAGELGHNPHGIVFDEILTQRDGKLWEALRTSMGTREQPMMVAATTAGDDPKSFAAKEHREMLKILEDPSIAPHIFVYIRALSDKDDPWNEKNWPKANPALGDFLQIQALRDEAKEAKSDPTKENSFLQFRCNRWVSQTTRLIQLHVWDECDYELLPEPDWMLPDLEGRRTFAGLDLSAKIDLTSWCLLFPFEAKELDDDESDDDLWWARWRFWLPEAQLRFLDGHTAGQVSMWANEGWITVTEGDVIDYERVYGDIEDDAARFQIRHLSYDPWSSEPVIQEVEKRTSLQVEQMTPVQQTYAGMSDPTTTLLTMLKDYSLAHGGNPVARWNADSIEARKSRDNPDLIRPVKPDRAESGARIDGMVSLILSIDASRRAEGESVYETRGLTIL